MTEPRKNFLSTGNDAFRCEVCGAEVKPLARGFRNHCPICLWSKHVDKVPGDRADECGGRMRPTAVEGGAADGWIIVHECISCGERRRIRAATDDPAQPDNWDRLVEVSAGDPTEPP